MARLMARLVAGLDSSEQGKYKDLAGVELSVVWLIHAKMEVAEHVILLLLVVAFLMLLSKLTSKQGRLLWPAGYTGRHSV